LGDPTGQGQYPTGVGIYPNNGENSTTGARIGAVGEGKREVGTLKEEKTSHLSQQRRQQPPRREDSVL